MQKWLSSGLLLVVGVLCISFNGFAQNDTDFDLSLVEATDFHDHRFDPRKPQYMFANSRWYLKYNPVTGTFGGLMFVYQRYISQQISADCLFHQSCSRFSVACIRRYGIVKGVALSADRLMRCNQLAAGGIHPSSLHKESHRVVDPLDNYHLKDY